MNKIHRLVESIFRVPEQNRWFTVRFLLVTYCGLLLLIILSLFFFPPLFGSLILPVQNTVEGIISNTLLVLWMCVGVRYIVLGVRMRKVLDIIGVSCVGLFSFLLIFALSQGG